MCCLKLPCVEFSACLSPAHLQANVMSLTVHMPCTILWCQLLQNAGIRTCHTHDIRMTHGLTGKIHWYKEVNEHTLIHTRRHCSVLDIVPFQRRTGAYNRPWTTEVSISGSANYTGLVVSGWAAVCRDWLRVMPCPISPSALSQMQLRNSGPT